MASQSSERERRGGRNFQKDQGLHGLPQQNETEIPPVILKTAVQAVFKI